MKTLARPEAVAVLFDLAGEVNRTRSAAQATLLKALVPVWACYRGQASDFLQAGAGWMRRTSRPKLLHRCGQGRENFCRSRPYPRRSAGPGHCAQRQPARHDLGGSAVTILRIKNGSNPCGASGGSY